MFKIFTRKGKNAPKKANKQLIERAYQRRIKDIESLRQYDRGEKEIHAPDIRNIVPGIRRSV
jgi:hypothetical protein